MKEYGALDLICRRISLFSTLAKQNTFILLPASYSIRLKPPLHRQIIRIHRQAGSVCSLKTERLKYERSRRQLADLKTNECL